MQPVERKKPPADRTSLPRSLERPAMAVLGPDRGTCTDGDEGPLVVRAASLPKGPSSGSSMGKIFNEMTAPGAQARFASMKVVEVNNGSREMFTGIEMKDGSPDLTRARLADGEILATTGKTEIEGTTVILLKTRHGFFAYSKIPPDQLCDLCPALVGIEASRNITLREPKREDDESRAGGKRNGDLGFVFLVAINEGMLPIIIRAASGYKEAMKTLAPTRCGVLGKVEQRRLGLKLAKAVEYDGASQLDEFGTHIYSAAVCKEQDCRYYLIIDDKGIIYRIYVNAEPADTAVKLSKVAEFLYNKDKCTLYLEAEGTTDPGIIEVTRELRRAAFIKGTDREEFIGQIGFVTLSAAYDRLYWHIETYEGETYRLYLGNSKPSPSELDHLELAAEITDRQGRRLYKEI